MTRNATQKPARSGFRPTAHVALDAVRPGRLCSRRRLLSQAPLAPQQPEPASPENQGSRESGTNLNLKLETAAPDSE